MAALGLPACGGDDDTGRDQPQATADQAAEPSQTQTEEQERSSGTTGSSGTSGKRRGEQSPAGGGESESLDLDNSEPAPPKQRGSEADLPRGAPQARSQLKPEDRQVYDVALFFCRQAGIRGLRREYSIQSSDPEDIAREAARRTADRGDVKAVYSGCLTGLRGGG